MQKSDARLVATSFMWLGLSLVYLNRISIQALNKNQQSFRLSCFIYAEFFGYVFGYLVLARRISFPIREMCQKIHEKNKN